MSGKMKAGICWLSTLVVMLGLSGCVGGGTTSEQAQTLYASLSGGQVVPAVITTAGGYARLHVSADRRATGYVQIDGVTATAVTIHAAWRGYDDALAIASLVNQGNGLWQVSDFPLSENERQSFLDGDFYVSVETLSYPDGEVRGQLDQQVLAKTATLNGNQAVPQVATSGTAEGILVVDTLTQVANGAVTLAGNAVLVPTAVKLYQGAVGVDGSEIATLTQSSADPALWLLPAVTFDSGELSAFQSGNTYFSVLTVAHPGGEIRGQLQ